MLCAKRLYVELLCARQIRSRRTLITVGTTDHAKVDEGVCGFRLLVADR